MASTVRSALALLSNFRFLWSRALGDCESKSLEEPERESGETRESRRSQWSDFCRLDRRRMCPGNRPPTRRTDAELNGGIQHPTHGSILREMLLSSNYCGGSGLLAGFPFICRVLPIKRYSSVAIYFGAACGPSTSTSIWRLPLFTLMPFSLMPQ